MVGPRSPIQADHHPGYRQGGSHHHKQREMAFDQDATLIRMASPRISLYNLVSTRFAPPDRRGVGVWDAAALTCYRVGWVINQTEKKHPLHRVMSEVQRRYIGDEGTPPAKQHV